MNSNYIVKDILIILGLSVIMALWFNFFGNSNGIPLIREKQEVAMASDDEFSLVDTTGNLSESNSNSLGADTIPSAVKDTIIKKKDSSVKAPIETATSIPAKPKSVSYKQVLQLLKDPKTMIIDARNEHEFADGHLPRAKNIFAMEFEQFIPELIGLDKEIRIVVYCGGGQCELSHEVSNNLIGLGFKKVYIYLGGWDDWNNNGAGK